MVLIILEFGIPMMLAIIFCVYIFYKGIKEKNKIKIIIPLILFVLLRKQIILVVLVVLYFLAVLFFPFIIGAIISAIAICLIKKIIVGKENFKDAVCIIIVICVFISFKMTPLWYDYASERPDDTYVKIKEMDDNQSLIGLSKEQVEELLGEKSDKNAEVYYYGAGKVTDYISSDNTFYVFEIYFDENDIVKSTLLHESP